MCAMDTCTLHRTRITVLLREPSPLFLSRHMEDLQVWHDLIVSRIASYNVIFSPFYITCTSTYLPNFFISKHHQTLRSELVLFKQEIWKEGNVVSRFLKFCLCVCVLLRLLKGFAKIKKLVVTKLRIISKLILSPIEVKNNSFYNNNFYSVRRRQY